MTLTPRFAHALLYAGVLLAPALSAQTLAEVERRIVPVAEWGGTPADAALARKHAITHITLHHQGEPFPVGKDPVRYLRNLQTWSRTTKRWLDIPYHYIIDLDGRTYEGRKLDYAGDTNTDYDPAGHALIEVVGNFEEVQPNQKQLDAVVDLMALLAAKHKVSIDGIHGHKDYAAGTVCPGVNLYRYLQDGYFRNKVALRLAGEQ
ncbi:MAG TPA: peptidoglycan recognition family protein [Telluria sp.]